MSSVSGYEEIRIHISERKWYSPQYCDDVGYQQTVGLKEIKMTTTIEKIERQIKENPILLYMKGSPKLPNCGFSAQAVQALSACGERFAYVDILQNPDIRAELPKYANWPTFPQLWVEGELIGGCDIIIEMYQRGELQTLIKETADKYRSQDENAKE